MNDFEVGSLYSWHEGREWGIYIGKRPRLHSAVVFMFLFQGSIIGFGKMSARYRRVKLESSLSEAVG